MSSRTPPNVRVASSKGCDQALSSPSWLQSVTELLDAETLRAFLLSAAQSDHKLLGTLRTFLNSYRREKTTVSCILTKANCDCGGSAPASALQSHCEQELQRAQRFLELKLPDLAIASCRNALCICQHLSTAQLPLPLGWLDVIKKLLTSALPASKLYSSDVKQQELEHLRQQLKQFDLDSVLDACSPARRSSTESDTKPMKKVSLKAPAARTRISAAITYFEFMTAATNGQQKQFGLSAPQYH